MDASEFKRAAQDAVDDITSYISSLEYRPVVSQVTPGYLKQLLPDSAPESPEAWETIRADVESKILPGITNWQSPYFAAFFPCSSSYPAMLAEMYSNAFNGSHFNWICSPASTELETIVMDWLAKLLNLSGVYMSTSANAGGGVIHGSASEAILTSMVAARDKFLRQATRHLLDGEDKEDELWRIRSKMVALGSEMSHSSTKKAAQVLGIRYMSVPASRDSYSMTGEAFVSIVEACKRKGLCPFYLTATLGTTDTCAIDDFAGVAAYIRSTAPQSDDIWVHVDAAYAGSALVLPEYQYLTAQFDAFHSFNFNPHKWLLTNFDCSALWVRDRSWFVEALSIQPPYLKNQFSQAGMVTDYRDWQIPLGRRFRSLKLWFVLRSYGATGIRDHISKGIVLGNKFAGMVRQRDDLFEILSGPQFALVVLTCVGKPGWTLEQRNRLTEKLLNAINRKGEIYLTPTVLHGKYAIRVCTGNTQTIEERHTKRLFEIIVQEAEEHTQEIQTRL